MYGEYFVPQREGSNIQPHGELDMKNASQCWISVRVPEKLRDSDVMFCGLL